MISRVKLCSLFFLLVQILLLSCIENSKGIKEDAERIKKHEIPDSVQINDSTHIYIEEIETKDKLVK